MQSVFNRILYQLPEQQTALAGLYEGNPRRTAELPSTATLEAIYLATGSSK